MSDGIGTTTFTYTQMGQLASETGPWASDTISCTYIDRLRQSLNLQQPNGSGWTESYGHDAANRLQSITSAAGLFQYSYNAGLSGTSSSALVGGISLPNGSFITNTFDGNARMTGTWLYNSSATALDYAGYTYNQGNQRTVAIREEPNSISNNYTYDKIGEVTGDQAYQESGTPRLNEQLTYAFDPAGNLNYRTNNALIQNFRVNSVNELTTNTNGGTLTVMGTTTSPATNVTVNGINASNYSDATFAATNLALTTTYTAVANDSYGRSSTSTVNVSISTNVGFQYDGNGNLTNDGLRNFVYDDENELIQVSVSNQWMSQFSYDGKMRRRIRNEFTWQGSWVQTNEVYYVYDGNLVIQERDINNLPTVTYTRGKDLSGGLAGAGGIGGLLARTAQAYVDAPLAGNSFYHADANGNITMLIDSSQGIVAKYLYDAFGNTISASGLLANANVYRFSSKEWHQNSGLAYYLYRYYDPNLQRWLNRDPIGEDGGINVYRHVYNSPVNLTDPYGLLAPTPGPLPVAVGAGEAAAGTGAVVVGGVVVAGAATAGLIGYDLYLVNQINTLNQQNQQAEKCYNQKRIDYEDYKDKCQDVDPPPGLTPCQQARWQLQRKLACKQGREQFTSKYYGGGYDWGHQRYMHILNSEIGALEDWIKQNCP